MKIFVQPFRHKKDLRPEPVGKYWPDHPPLGEHKQGAAEVCRGAAKKQKKTGETHGRGRRLGRWLFFLLRFDWRPEAAVDIVARVTKAPERRACYVLPRHPVSWYALRHLSGSILR